LTLDLIKTALSFSLFKVYSILLLFLANTVPGPAVSAGQGKWTQRRLFPGEAGRTAEKNIDSPGYLTRECE